MKYFILRKLEEKNPERNDVVMIFQSYLESHKLIQVHIEVDNTVVN